MNEARQTAESYLQQERVSLTDEGIWPSEVRVIDSLLKHGESLDDAYSELLDKFPARWESTLKAVVTTGAFWTPELVALDRAAVRRVQELTDEIADKAQELAALMRTRREYMEDRGIRGPDDAHPVDILNAASDRIGEDSYLFQQRVMPALKRLRTEFDLKYWPRTADFLEALADAQGTEDVTPYHAFTATAMQTRQGHTPLDFVRALDEALTELGISLCKLSHRFFAEIANCSLDLPADKTLTKDNIKAFRAYQRKQGG